MYSIEVTTQDLEIKVSYTNFRHIPAADLWRRQQHSLSQVADFVAKRQRHSPNQNVSKNLLLHTHVH
jgi:hypothetical protein